MKPVMQTTPSNCYAACVASILECDIDTVPISGDDWDWDRLQKWLLPRGIQLLDIILRDEHPIIYPMQGPSWCILSGPSPRLEGKAHAVVGRTHGLDGFDIVHDPHEQQSGLVDNKVTHITFFALCDPAMGK